MKTLVLVVVGFCSSACLAADITWKSSVSSGAFNVGANWTGNAAPTSADTAKIVQSGTLDLSATADGSFKIWKIAASGGDLTVNVNPSPYQLVGANAAWGDSLFVNGTSAYSCWYNQTGGVVSNLCGVVVGDSGPHGRVTVAGAGTRLLAYRDNTRLGSSKSDCALEVLDGAVFRSGRETIIGYGAAVMNTRIRVSGAGSMYWDCSDSNVTQLPRYGHHNSVVVENGAVWTNVTGNSYLGNGAATHHNEFFVTNGASLWMSKDFYVGYNGSDNRLVIDDRSVADLRSVFTIGSSASATNNSVYIGANSVVRNPHHTVIGYDGSVSSRLEVVHAAFTNSTFDVGVGRHAHAGLLRVADGAQFYVNRRFAVGAPKSFDSPDAIVSAPRDNTAIVEGAGSLLHVPCVLDGSSVNIGWYGTNNAMIVRDGGYFKVGGLLWIGPKANAVSNRLVVAGKESRLTVGSASYLGSLGSNNELRIEDGAQVQLKKLHVGNGNGACSNVVFVGSGAVVSNSFAVIVGTSNITDPSSAVGNGIIVSNAVMRNSLDADEAWINLRGKGGYLKVIDGGVFTVHQSICVGGDYNSGNAFSDCSDGLIEVRGKGSYMEATRYHFGIGRCGHDNGVVIADGGACVLHDNMRIGCEGRAGATNNYLHISNGSFSNNSSQRLYLYNNSRLIWEGSQSTAKLSTIEAHEAAQFDFIFDKDGIAAFGPTYETYMIDAAHKPTVSKFRIDATKYVRNRANPYKKTFTILKSNDNRQCRVVGTGADLPSADFEAINAAFRDLIVCEPAENVKVTKVDLQHSRIEVEVTVPHGMAIIFR